jgi:hypothetical protein
MSTRRGGSRALLLGDPIEGGAPPRSSRPLDSAAIDMTPFIPEMLGRAGQGAVFTISSRVVERICNPSVAAALIPLRRTGSPE